MHGTLTTPFLDITEAGFFHGVIIVFEFPLYLLIKINGVKLIDVVQKNLFPL